MIERQDEPASQIQVLWNGMMMQGKRNVLLMAIGGGWLSLFMAGLLSYQGSLIIYLVFSAGYLLLLLSAFRNQSTYVYVYLAILLWLGFWLKVTFHYLFSHPFVEPAGRFTETAATWDEVLLVATSAAVGVYISRILFQLLSGNGQSIFGTNADVPGWLTTYGTLHLAAFLCGLVVFTVANIYFGIFVIGFEVRTILPWPLNALITLMLVGGGFVVWAASMTWWRMLSGRRLFLTLLAMIVCGTLITFSTLSRGGVVFFTLPILYAVYFNRKMIPGYSTSKAILVLVIFGLAVATSFLAVNQIRDRLYYHKPPTTSSPTTSSPATVQARSFLNFAVDRWPQARSFLNFAVDRWLGVEGVMAVSAYPGIGGKLLVEGVFEKPEHGRPTIYQTICPWPSTPQFDSLRENVNLFSMPGGVAFFYYSGSVIVVILFVILIAFLLQCTELLIFLITGNPILCSGLGWLMAVTFIHFGGVPRYQVPTFIFLVFAVAAAGVIQSKKTASILEALTE